MIAFRRPFARFLLLTLAALAGGVPAAAAQDTQPPPPEVGQVAVTLTLESLRIPMVTVELINVDTNAVIGRTTSDGVGQATFPDVPPGRYLVRATRDGFADVEAAAFRGRRRRRRRRCCWRCGSRSCARA